ncbi:MAG: DUF5107 domain-containing protein [Planctomycetes bacterium]|nr:DUF5107 domain-containing protein [Planctomycetota bacterium]
MTTLTFATLTLPAASLGPENPLPVLAPPHRPSKPAGTYDPSLTEEDTRHFGYGRVGMLPHRLQDGYDRRRRPRTLRTAVLENGILRATFVPELGGRLWSLVHKSSGRELLYVNPVFQPANLAIRNAWFSGGVEWNIGWPGHHAQTCSPLFAAACEDGSGRPFLRLWEWCRVRQVPYQIDAHLDDDSPFLYVHVRIDNPHETVVPMYWWSNIAVPEAPDVRVLAPADQAIGYDYGRTLARMPFPLHRGIDESYPVHLPSAADRFFCLPAAQRPWVAGLDGRGTGLIQTSTPLLRGRKLFAWGMSPGGRHWQEFLSVPGSAYIELQAGLGRTQLECLPMPAGARWQWLEAYGLMEADPAAVHGADWAQATGAVGRRLDAMLPARTLDEAFERTCAAADRPAGEIVQHGSGWGALERLRRQRDGEPPCFTAATAFPDESLGPDQHPWRELLDRGALPAGDPTDPPGAFMVQPAWRRRLEEGLGRGEGDHWLSWWHLGLMRHHAGEIDGARTAWRTSLERTGSAWAWRNLAVLAAADDRAAEAADHYLHAWSLGPPLLPLAVECCRALLAADRPGEALGVLDGLPGDLAAHGRVRLLRARALLAGGDADAAIDVLGSQWTLSDVREGEVSLTDLWVEAHARRVAAEEGRAVDDDLRARVRAAFPPPSHLDFRMA